MTDDIKEDFDAMVKIFKGGNKHLRDMFDEFGNSYITGIYIMNYKTIDIKKVKASNPLTSRKRAAENIDTRYAYINTELDLSRSTLKAALEKAHYTKTNVGLILCWMFMARPSFHKTSNTATD